MPDIPLGRFCWYELLTTDPDSAPGFYGQIAGWETTPWDGAGGQPYAMWMNGDAPIGGLMQLPDEAIAGGAPPHWLVHISTPDLEATKAKAIELGGEILMQVAVPEVGTFATIRDPQGAVFSAYQPSGEAPGHDDPSALGEFSWNELAALDREAAWSFYSALFGWEKGDAPNMDHMGVYQMFSRGAHPVGGMFDKPAEMPGGGWLFYIDVPDVAAAVEKIKELGGTVLNGPMEVPGGDLVAQCMDPQGAAFAVHAIPKT